MTKTSYPLASRPLLFSGANGKTKRRPFPWGRPSDAFTAFHYIFYLFILCIHNFANSRQYVPPKRRREPRKSVRSVLRSSQTADAARQASPQTCAPYARALRRPGFLTPQKRLFRKANFLAEFSKKGQKRIDNSFESCYYIRALLIRHRNMSVRV